MTDYTPTTEQMRALIRFIGDVREVGDEALAEFDRWHAPYEKAVEAVQRIRDLHRPAEMSDPAGISQAVFTGCVHCTEMSALDDEWVSVVLWPCLTIKALGGEQA